MVHYSTSIPEPQNFTPFCQTASRFLVFWDKRTELLQNDLEHYKGQAYPHIFCTSTPESQNSLQFPPKQYPFFELQASLRQVHRMLQAIAR